MIHERALPSWLLTAAVITVSVVGCAGEGEEGPPAELAAAEKTGGLAVVCYESAVEALNPFVSPDLAAADLRLLLFTPLVLYDDAGDFRPYLATGWRWEDDGVRLILEIRQDVAWHDGMPLTADDVAWTINAAANPEYAYWNGADFATLDVVQVRDSVTLELRFTEPLIAELEPFVALPILPRHLLADFTPEEFSRAEYQRSPVGSGPYKVAGRRPDGVIDFERAEGFPADLGEAYLERIAVRWIPEATTLAAEMEAGTVDLCVTGSGRAERLQSSGRVEVHPIEPAGIQAIFLNSRHPPLDDSRVRRALSAAVRRSEIAAVVSPLASPSGTLFPASGPWTDPELVQPDADSALAASLLESAGWSLAGDGVRTNAEGRELRFTLVAPPPLEVPLTVLQAQLRHVGVAVDLRFMEFAAFIGMIQKPDSRPDAMALGFVLEKLRHPYNEIYAHLHSEGHSNLGSYSDPAVDSLVERLQTRLSSDERRDIYRQLQRRVTEDVPAIYILYVPRVLAIGGRLQGVREDLNGPFGSVTEWWIPPARRRVGP